MRYKKCELNLEIKMPLVAEKLKSALKTRIYNALEKEFSKDSKDNPKAKEHWQKMASAISEIAEDIVNTLQQDAQVSAGIPIIVNPGIGTASGGATVTPGAGMTSSPGKII